MRKFPCWGSLPGASHELSNGKMGGGPGLRRVLPAHAHSARRARAQEKVCWPARQEPVPACGAGNSGGQRDDGENPDCRNEADRQPQPRVSPVAATLWRSTCRQCSNRGAEIGVESAAAAAKLGKCRRPPRGYRIQGPPGRRRAGLGSDPVAVTVLGARRTCRSAACTSKAPSVAKPTCACKIRTHGAYPLL